MNILNPNQMGLLSPKPVNLFRKKNGLTIELDVFS